jgi:hypothetical protein
MQIPLLATLLSRFQVCSATVYTAILETSCKAVDCIVRHLSVDVVDEVVLALGGTVRIDAPADLDTGAVLKGTVRLCRFSRLKSTNPVRQCRFS